MIVRIESLKKLERNKKISSYSPSLLIAEKLSLKYLIVEENNITGPAVGTSILVDRLTKNFRFEKMLDLCCGTGAITKIALLNGVKISYCVDKNLKAAKENLKEFSSQIVFLKKDIFKLKLTEDFDLAVLDPPRYIVERVIEKFDFNKISTKLFVVWHGSSEEKEWHYYAKSVLEKYFEKIYSFSIYGEELFVCSRTEIGNNILEKFFKIW